MNLQGELQLSLEQDCIVCQPTMGAKPEGSLANVEVLLTPFTIYLES